MSDIQKAFSYQTPLAVGIALLKAGISILPVYGKKPAVRSWARFQSDPMTASEFVHIMGANIDLGVAVIAGDISKNLVIIDLDGNDAVRRFHARFPDLFESLTVASGSGTGQHIYLFVHNLPPNKRKNGIEIRGNGCYTVAPPSYHPVTGRQYRVLNHAPVLELDNLNVVVRWLSGNDIPPQPVPPSRPPRPDGKNDSWVNAAFHRELNHLRTASKGNVNNMLNAVSYRLARICANPNSGLDVYLTQSAILDTIPDYIAREGERAARATMLSGWTAGFKKPATIPEARHGRGH